MASFAVGLELLLLAIVLIVLPMVTTITEEHRNSGLPFRCL